MRAILLLAAFGLAGCQTQQISEMSYSDVRQLAAEIADRCNAQGFRHPSAAFDQCVQHEIRREELARANNRASFERFRYGLADALAGAGQGYSRAAAIPSPSPSPSFRCTTRPGLNGSTTTSCN